MFELDVLKSVTQNLNTLGIPYMLTGSVAANYYTSPRMTRDFDIVIELESSDIHSFIKTLSDDFFLDDFSIQDALAQKSMFNIIHKKNIIKIDFIIRKSSIYRQTEFKRRKEVHFQDFSFWIVSIEDLILSKLDWAKDSFSEMQIKDIKNLLQNKTIDHSYLNEWIVSLKLENIWSRACQ